MSDPHQRTHTPPISIRLGSYFINHARVLFSSIGYLHRSMLSSVMTIAVIAIALALPSGLYVLLKNAQKLSGNWDGATSISLYLKQGTNTAEATALNKHLGALPHVESTQFIDREAALEEFRQLSGFGNAMQALDENPLPMVIIITPSIDTNQPDAIQSLLENLKQQPQVEHAQLDLQWVKRLYSIINIVQRGLLIIASLLCLAVILVIGNTIRLDIQNRRTEIEVIKLIGGTNAFIRRPFLYEGMWYGLLGGVGSWLLITICLSMLRGPVQRLAGLYDSQFELINLSFSNTLLLILSAVILGLLGSWLAVGRHLNEIEPG